MESGLLSQVQMISRPQLGEELPLVIFRAFRIFSGRYLKDLMGEKGATAIFQNAGRDLGKELYNLLKADTLESYIDNICNFVRETRIGLLVPERIDEEVAVVRLDECLTCAGMPNIGERICHFEVGIVAGLFESFLGARALRAVETKCNANGEETCQVTVQLPQG